MDGASRHTAVSRGRKPTQRTRRLAKSGELEGERYRLIQLIVSLALFLLVYFGRGVFPAQLESWRTVSASNVDFAAAFQRFSGNIAQGAPMTDALEALCVTLMGGKAGEMPSSEPSLPQEQVQMPVGLSHTSQMGLDYLNQHGILAGTSFFTKEDEPAERQPESEPPGPAAAAVVTAVAQEYTDDGVKLPRNVSMAFYELGLDETAVPVMGTATSGFGYRDSPINGKNEFHLALDIGAEEGTEIGAFAAGTVEYIGTSDEFGNYLKISHKNNVSSFYAHCSKLLVHKGDQVACGQTVALVGHTGNATGSHLHLTIEKDNIRLDPAYYVDLS